MSSDGETAAYVVLCAMLASGITIEQLLTAAERLRLTEPSELERVRRYLVTVNGDQAKALAAAAVVPAPTASEPIRPKPLATGGDSGRRQNK